MLGYKKQKMIYYLIMKHKSQKIINAIILYLNDKFLKSLSLEFKNAGIRPVKFSLVDNDLTEQSFLVCECDYAKLNLCIDNIHKGTLMLLPFIVPIEHSAETEEQRADGILSYLSRVLIGPHAIGKIEIDSGEYTGAWTKLDMSDLISSSMSELKMKLAIRGFL